MADQRKSEQGAFVCHRLRTKTAAEFTLETVPAPKCMECGSTLEPHGPSWWRCAQGMCGRFRRSLQVYLSGVFMLPQDEKVEEPVKETVG